MKKPKVLLVSLNPVSAGVALAPYLMKAVWLDEPELRDGLDLEVIDENVDVNAETLIQKAKDADFVGFSCYVWNVAKMLEVINGLKALDPAKKCFAGGPEVSHRASHYLGHSALDLVVRGEGEHTFRDLFLSVIKQGWNKAALSPVSGISFREDSEVVTNLERPLIADLSEVPSPFLSGALNLETVGSHLAAFETNRGCPFRCGFCTWGVLGQVRYFPLERVKAELRAIMKSPVRRVWIADAVSNMHRKRLVEILDIILEEEGGSCIFDFEMVAELLNEELIERLARLKSGYIAFGLQTTNAETLKIAGRRFEADKFRSNFQRLRSLTSRLELNIDVIYGLPGDRYEDFEASLDFALELDANLVNVHRLTLLPGSSYFSNADKLGIVFEPEAPYRVFRTPQFSEQDFARGDEWAKRLRGYYRDHFRFGVKTVSEKLGLRLMEGLRRMDAFLARHGKSLADFFLPSSSVAELCQEAQWVSEFVTQELGEEPPALQEYVRFLALSAKNRGRRGGERNATIDEDKTLPPGVEKLQHDVYLAKFRFPVHRSPKNIQDLEAGEPLELMFHYGQGRMVEMPRATV